MASFFHVSETASKTRSYKQFIPFILMVQLWDLVFQDLVVRRLEFEPFLSVLTKLKNHSIPLSISRLLVSFI